MLGICAAADASDAQVLGLAAAAASELGEVDAVASTIAPGAFQSRTALADDLRAAIRDAGASETDVSPNAFAAVVEAAKDQLCGAIIKGSPQSRRRRAVSWGCSHHQGILTSEDTRALGPWRAMDPRLATGKGKEMGAVAPTHLFTNNFSFSGRTATALYAHNPQSFLKLYCRRS
mgnify:CR=1 FL=1